MNVDIQKLINILTSTACNRNLNERSLMIGNAILYMFDSFKVPVHIKFRQKVIQVLYVINQIKVLKTIFFSPVTIFVGDKGVSSP